MRQMFLTLAIASAVLVACGDGGSKDRARSVQPPPAELQARRTTASRQVRAQWDGWREGRRRALADEILRAQSQGPDEFRASNWLQLALITLLTLIIGFAARVFMSLKMPAWWPFKQNQEKGPPAPGTPPDTPDSELPLLMVLVSRAWELTAANLSRLGNLLVGPAPRDHVWRQEIHQSRDAERDLAAAAKAAAELPGVETTTAKTESAEPTEQPESVPQATETDEEAAPQGEPDDAPDKDAAPEPVKAPEGDPILVQALNAWRSEVATARRSLENLEPLDNRRELLAALDATQATAAELRVALTRASMAGGPIDQAMLDYWRRLVGARPGLNHLTPKGESPDGDKGWGHGMAVLALAASALGIFCIAAWAAAGALPLVFGLGFGIGGAVAYGVARVQLDRTGRPRLLPGVADRLATRVATTALVVALVAWGSLMFGDDTDLGLPPNLEMPAELRIPVSPAAVPTEPVD